MSIKNNILNSFIVSSIYEVEEEDLVSNPSIFRSPKLFNDNFGGLEPSVWLDVWLLHSGFDTLVEDSCSTDGVLVD